MATNLEKFQSARVYFVGVGELAYAASVSIARNTNAQKVNTLAGGFKGVSEGAKEMEIQVESAVPSPDFEISPNKFKMDALKPQEIIIYHGAKRLQTKGFVMSDNFSSSVGSETKLSFSMACSWAEWEV